MSVIRGPGRSAPIRLILAGLAAAALSTAVGTGGGSVAAGAAPGAPALPAASCPAGDGVLVTADMLAAVAASDGHDITPAGGSVAAGCGHQHVEDPGGWPEQAPVGPDDAASDEPADPFSTGSRQYGYQFGVGFDDGPPDYWEQPVALPLADWSGAGSVGYLWVAGDTGASIGATLPRAGVCAYQEPVPADVVPGRIAAYRRRGHPRIYLYDHVPLRQPANDLRDGGGGWYHYLCGASTPAGIAAPTGRLSAVEGDYYSTPHWVYARGWSAAQLTRLAPLWRAARARLQVDDVVRTSPARRSVVNLAVWMWVPPGGYELRAGGLRARVEPTGIVVRAPDVPLHAHDSRAGGCGTGGRPYTGESTVDTDCYLVFDRASGTEVYTVGFGMRWTVTVRTDAGAPVGRPVTVWTTSVRQFSVGEVQVVVVR
jgi:hypothetical protein